MTLSVTEAQNKLQNLSTEYQKLEVEISGIVESRQKLESQLKENEMVKEEFKTLTSENTVYKLIGTILVKQDQAEAKSNVNTRLEFIRNEIKRVETQIADMTAKSEKTKNEIVAIQAAFRQQQQQDAPTTAWSSDPTRVQKEKIISKGKLLSTIPRLLWFERRSSLTTMDRYISQCQLLLPNINSRDIWSPWNRH